ncbi:MAG TPA: glycosyltransferase family 39 protein [Streptosporangiaceae bacterium]|nr:glycosyltransferase family 39 protein [Streptosporangiaceae bacterium]
MRGARASSTAGSAGSSARASTAGGSGGSSIPASTAVDSAGQRAPAGEQAADLKPGTLAGSDRLPGWLVVVVPALVELIVGGYRISGPSLWRDEAATISGSQRPLSAIMALTLHQDAVHGIYYLLMHVVVAIGGVTETALRLPSLIAMCLAVGLTAALGQRLADNSALPAPKLTGLLAGLLVVVVPLTTRYAQEARPYALTTLFAVLATYLLVRAAASGRWPWWAGYAAALAVTGLVNLFAVLLAVAHGLAVFAARTTGPGVQPPPGTRPASRTLSRWLIATAIAGVLLAPLAVASIKQSGQLNWVTRPDPSTVASLMRDFSGATLLIPVIAALGILGCVAGPGLRRGGFTLGWVALPWLLVPPVLLLAISLADPLYVERYVVFCLPALSLLAAAGLVWLIKLSGEAATKRGIPAGRTRLLAVLPSALLAAAIIGGLVGPQLAIRLPSARADNLRAVAAVLGAHERPGDAILYLPWDTAVISRAYPVPYAKLRDVGLGQTPIASATLRGLPAAPRVMLGRLRFVSRAWTVQWIPPVPSAGPVRIGLVTGSGLRLIRRWHIESVLLSLYARS